MDETISDSAPEPRRPAPAPPGADDETLASGQMTRKPATAGAALAFKTPERDLSGAQLGEYQLVRKIAVGGMGEVYEGVQLKLDRRVAVKLLSEELSREQEFLTRFEREAKSAAALNHPNVVQVYDFGCADGQYFFVMELVDGTDLSIYVKEHGKLPIPAALDYFEQAVKALKFAADHAIIHRDVKPANLMLTRDGTVKVSDLGLAKKLTDDSDVTMTGVGMGSPHFLAPEQADDAAHVDHRADIYALGVTLLYLLTGKRPFEGASNFSVVLAHANKPLPSGIELGTELPDAVEDFIKRMTQKRPEARYQTYEELLADLHRVKAGNRPTVNWLQVLRDPQNLQRLAIGAVALLIIGLAVPLVLPEKKPATPVASQPGTGNVRPPDHPDDKDIRPRFVGNDPDGKQGGGQNSRPRLPFPPPPEKNFTPLKDGLFPVMMQEADQYAAANKDELTPIVDRYWQIASKFRGTPQGQTAQLKMDNALLTHELRSHELIEQIGQRTRNLAKAGKLQEAWEAWFAFPTGWRTKETDAEIMTLIEQIFPPSFMPKGTPDSPKR